MGSIPDSNFNPRAPYGARRILSGVLAVWLLFQSTRPIRGATWPSVSGLSISSYFNPRAPYGARLVVVGRMARSAGFQSTRPIRGATAAIRADIVGDIISIHAPHTGRDFDLGSCPRVICPFQSTRPIRGATLAQRRKQSSHKHFNPRAPYGARPFRQCTFHHRDRISIHAPHTGRDSVLGQDLQQLQISIHAPHTGRDLEVLPYLVHDWNFNPRAPYGARQSTIWWCWAARTFQSTRPIRGATGNRVKGTFDLTTFQSTRPIRGATGLLVQL